MRIIRKSARNILRGVNAAGAVCAFSVTWHKRPRNISRVDLGARLVYCFAWVKVVFQYFFFEICWNNLNLCTSKTNKFGERWNVSFNEENIAFSPHESISTIAFINIHYLYTEVFMWRHIKPNLQVIILATAMLVSFLHSAALENTTKCPRTYYLVHATIPNYNWVTRIIPHTLGWNFKSCYEVSPKETCAFLCFFFSTRFWPAAWFPLWRSIEKTRKTLPFISLLHRRNSNFSRVRLLIFLSLCCNLVLWYELNKK